jgi:hypothetical protein
VRLSQRRGRDALGRAREGEVLDLLDNETGMHSMLGPQTKRRVDELVGWHTAKLGDRWAALEPLRQGVRLEFEGESGVPRIQWRPCRRDL